MKKIFKATAICLGALSLTACSDWLDTKTTSLQEENVVFNSVEQTSLAVMGVYADLCSDPYVQLQTIHQGAGTDCELIDGLGSTATNQNNERDGMNYNATPSWSKLGTLWDKQYKTIEDCNRVIDGINAGDLASDSEMMKYSAEARVIRAMVYLDLIRVFGDIPFRWDAAKSDLSNINQGKTDRDVILDAMIEDLEKVVEEDKLPWCGEKGTTQERINMGYAKGLLANIYMTRAGYAIREDNNEQAIAGGYNSAKKESDGYKRAEYPSGDNFGFLTLRPSDKDCDALYAKAEQHLKDIIDNPAHEMNETFAGFWESINKLELDPTHESMFEIPMGFGNAGELGYTVGVRINGGNKITTIDYGFVNSSGKVKTTAVQLYSYQPFDTRRDITCINFEIKDYDRSSTQTAEEKEKYSGGEDEVTIESRLSNKPFGLYIGKWDVRKMSDRWKVQNKSASAKFGYGINVVRMRYPQILLWYAECLAYRGEFGEAAKYVKDVHKRAFKDAPDATYQGDDARTTKEEDIAAFETKVDAATDYQSFLDVIDLENRLEFCGECFRKWDLIRWNRLHDNIWKEKTEYNRKKDEGIFQTKIYYKYLADDEKQIDASSVAWYGENGTNEIKGKEIATGNEEKQSTDYEWLVDHGYLTTSKDYNPGKGKDRKGLNCDSYSTSAFGTDYSKPDEFASICGGLVGTSEGKTVDEGLNGKVKNRYLMPIETNVLNHSGGRLYNSYGY